MARKRSIPAMSPARFRVARKRLGLTQEALARELDVSFVTVNRMEQGHSAIDAEMAGKLRALWKKRKTAA